MPRGVSLATTVAVRRLLPHPDSTAPLGLSPTGAAKTADAELEQRNALT